MAITKKLLLFTLLEAFIEFQQAQYCHVNYPWTYKNSKICFVITSYSGNRWDANNHCKALNPNIHLPIMKDIDTVNFVSDGLKEANVANQEIWVGIYKSGPHFFWFDGTPISANDSLWHIGEPNGNGKCVAMWTKTKNLNGIEFRTLDDTSCSVKRLTVCSCKAKRLSQPKGGAEELFKQSPSLAPYENDFQKSTAAGANPVLELEKVGLKAARDLLNSNQTDVTETVQTEIMKMQISKFSVSRFKGQLFTSIGDKSTFTLPASALEVANASADYAATVGIAYSQIESTNDMGYQATLGNSSVMWKLDSDVMSFSVVYDGLNLTEPVVMTFQSKTPIEKQKESTCAFWNATLNAWSEEGCYKMTNDSNTTTCHCYHLTTFASLMQVIPDPKSQFTKTELFVINLITKICFGLSYISIIITIASFIVSRTLSKPSNVIHLNLCISILFAQTVFLSGVKATGNQSICKFVALLLHYLYLSVGCWMFVEGFYILRMTRRIFNRSSNVLGYCVVGWGFPALFVAVLFAGLNRYYGHSEACWLNKETGAIWAFSGPMILILIFNVIVLVAAIKAALNIRLNRTKSEREKIGVGLKAVIILLPLLGLTWIFGLFAIGTAATAMQIIFAIANGLQGFFIFVFHCARNPEIKGSRFFTRHTNNSGFVRNKVLPSKSTTGAVSLKKAQTSA